MDDGRHVADEQRPTEGEHEPGQEVVTEEHRHGTVSGGALAALGVMGIGREKPAVRYRVGDPWRAEVLARVAVVQAMTDAAEAGAAVDGRMSVVCGRIRALLDDAEQHAHGVQRPRFRWLQDWRSGGSIERAWRNLHGAEILLAEIVDLDELASQRPAVRSMAQRVLSPTDARTIAIEQRLSDEAWKSAGEDPVHDRRLRREYVAALTWVSDACDKNFTRVRSFRNIVLATSVGLAVVAVALGLVGAASPNSLPLCFDPGTTAQVCPTGTDQGPTGGDAALVLAVGLTAGAFAAALSVRGIRGTSTPYGVPVAIAWLKLPAGALTALFGMLMVHGGFVPGLSALDTQGQIIAYSIVLGYAQQVFTRLIDSQAQAVLDKAPSSEPATATKDPAAVGNLAIADV